MPRSLLPAVLVFTPSWKIPQFLALSEAAREGKPGCVFEHCTWILQIFARKLRRCGEPCKTYETEMSLSVFRFGTLEQSSLRSKHFLCVLGVPCALSLSVEARCHTLHDSCHEPNVETGSDGPFATILNLHPRNPNLQIAGALANMANQANSSSSTTVQSIKAGQVWISGLSMAGVENFEVVQA